MAKKKKRKNKGLRLFGNGVTGGVATEIIGNVLGQLVSEAVETYLSDKKNRKRLVKMMRRLTSRRASSRV